jgi:2-dehydro-3-deoxyphosphogluconate aldolase/(4S)-4-hydroxy-2-oxoglutarate aldolase
MEAAMILEDLKKAKIISIIRGIDREILPEVVQALYNGGIRAVEIAFNTPGAQGMLETAKEKFGGKMLIGAGTVLDAETARMAIAAGADFLLSPSLDEGMIKTCNRYDKVAVPGVFTPTEIVRAYEYGAKIVKIFPASVLGTQYIEQIKGPLGHVEMVAVGGITLENFRDYLAGGACCVGIGSALVSPKTTRGHDMGLITQNALKYTAPDNVSR